MIMYTKQAKEEDGMGVKGMFDMIMKKLDIIDSHMEAMEDLNAVTSSVEFVHAEVQDLKEEDKISKKTEEETKQRLEKHLVEQMNSVLNKQLHH